MIEISLTEFVDFVSTSGTPKLTVVRRVKQRHREQYDPQTDFYKRFRDAVLQMHKHNRPKDVLDQMLNGLTDKKKQTAYPALVTGYKKFLGRKDVSWSRPPRVNWVHDELAVSVNPEIGLRINGERQVIKLYMKEPKLTKLRTDIVTHLMLTELQAMASSAQFGILDVRNGRLIPASDEEPGLHALLEGEAASFAQVYRSLP